MGSALLLSTLASSCCLPCSEVRIGNAGDAWEAAFNEAVPNGIVVTHGYYWRGIHWSGEHIWFFALKFNEDLVEQLSKDHRLKRHKAGP